ncbi:MAG: hypothetical protein PHW96_02845 [Candidatus Nanoarchaeia archaeon]|nr:hypothetical protein [Candidatus Nanoarchaeia archaeon]
MTVKKVSKKKKNWYTILSPKEYGETEVGKTLSKDDKSIINRIVEVTADELVKKGSKDQKVKVKLRVESIKETKAHTHVQELKLSDSYLSRLVKKKSGKIDAVMTLRTQDDKKIKLKVLLLTKSKLPRTKKALIKKMLEENSSNVVSDYKYAQLVYETILGKIQKAVKKDLHKIAVIRKVLITKVRLL